ncbi:hypothetical protein F4808DRAFT_278664 [Astrocystis sublimbata]|nr:hypothetical protein F4808DRAFT_278664 [Astrocystis sublimbata]
MVWYALGITVLAEVVYLMDGLFSDAEPRGRQRLERRGRGVLCFGSGEMTTDGLQPGVGSLELSRETEGQRRRGRERERERECACVLLAGGGGLHISRCES